MSRVTLSAALLGNAVALLLVAPSGASAATSAGASLDYSRGSAANSLMRDVGVTFGTVATEMPNACRFYATRFTDTSASTGFGRPQIATVSIEQAPLLQGGPGIGRQIVARVPDPLRYSDVELGDGVVAFPSAAPTDPRSFTAYATAGGAWTPGRDFRIRARQIASSPTARRFRLSVVNPATGFERKIVDFSRGSTTGLSVRAIPSVAANALGDAATCNDLYPGRASVERPAGARLSDGASVGADPSPFFQPTVGVGGCTSSLRLQSTGRLVVDLGR